MLDTFLKNVTRAFVFILVIAIFEPSLSQSLLPDTGSAAILQGALDLKGNLRVLSLALKPGHEDLETLAYLRFSLGVKIMSVYVSNGEAGESDLEMQYPYKLAVTRREEAYSAISFLDGEVFFLNMPDIASANDSHKVRLYWPTDTMQARLKRAILEFRPQVILLARDWEEKGGSILQRILTEDLLSTVKEMEKQSLLATGWKIDCIAVDNPKKRGLRPALLKHDTRFGKSYSEIGSLAAQSYHSLGYQWKSWRKGDSASYSILLNNRPTRRIPSFDGIFASKTVQNLTSLQNTIHKLADEIIRQKPQPTTPNTIRSLSKVVNLLDSLDNRLRRIRVFDQQSLKLLDWKNNLENLRNALLGVSVSYTFSETILTDRQLTFLRIDTVVGTAGGYGTEIYFPETAKGWIVNEGLEQRFPLSTGKEYRLISPSNLEYNLPREEYTLQRHRYTNPFTFFILGKAESRERSFVLCVTAQFDYAQRFTTEVLTPIVRVFDRERVVVRLTNHSRDGVQDTLSVRDTNATSQKSLFRLSNKEEFRLDTLILSWKPNLPVGEHIIPVSIGNTQVASFVGRKFDSSVDTSKRIAVWSGFTSSEIYVALRRLGITSVINLNDANFDSLYKLPIDVLILDRRALSLSSILAMQKSKIDSFVQHGGHLLILAQDADVWNTHPLIEGLQLTPSFALDEETAITASYSDAIMTIPNRVIPEDFEEWIFRRGFNRLSGPVLTHANIYVWTLKTQFPLLIEVREGRGSKMYTDLALHWQWMSLHPGAFRLFANLISRDPR
jgi:hypothetical protein